MTPAPDGLFSHPDVHRPARTAPPTDDDQPLFQEPLPEQRSRPADRRDDQV
ncbi:hypothetical protein ACQPW3_26525 [Actinosynnema sp. CA-248983]